ncbi:hypothetical protein [Archangium sp.]|uniref:hypothetical protein n=1 Tax=Archangium sp. TaxID=1872627 RepID=UPI00286A4339|nr:hypothetical protein [Archangium sp.]
MSSQTTPSRPFHLLLAGPEEGQEVRFQPDARALALLPRIAPMYSPPRHLGDDNADPNSLEAQRWGLVLPQGEDVEPLLRELAPLRELRKKQQRAPVRTYHVPKGLAGPNVHQWCDDNYEHDGTDEFERPRYLLLVGGFEQLSLELQQALSTRAWVGRLAFDRVADYGHYARKVCRWAESAGDRQAEALFYSVQDGTSATREGHAGLVAPGYRQLHRLQQEKKLSLAALRGPDEVGRAPKDFLDLAATARSAVLLSMSHGMRASAGGWRSVQEQLDFQGAMRFGFNRKVSGADVAKGDFLPGGFWLYFACFGAGTPAVSQYSTWLDQLRAADCFGEEVDGLVRSIEGPAPRPFAAALPQRALANPDGPLGVIAHVDLTWSDSFQETQDGTRSRLSRFLEPLSLLARGARAGIAAKKLAHAASAVENLLVEQYVDMSRGQEVDPVRLAQNWMLRQDLRSFVLLGDPAARLPLRPDISGVGG